MPELIERYNREVANRDRHIIESSIKRAIRDLSKKGAIGIDAFRSTIEELSQAKINKLVIIHTIDFNIIDTDEVRVRATIDGESKYFEIPIDFDFEVSICNRR